MALSAQVHAVPFYRAHGFVEEGGEYLEAGIRSWQAYPGGGISAMPSMHNAQAALFVAFAPVEAPTIAVAVIVENGGYGARAAVPLAIANPVMTRAECRLSSGWARTG